MQTPTKTRVARFEAAQETKDAKQPSFDELVQKAAQERAEILIEAKRVLGPNAKLDGTNDEIKVAVVKALVPSVSLDGKRSDLIDTAYQVALAPKAGSSGRTYAADAGEVARLEMEARNRSYLIGSPSPSRLDDEKRAEDLRKLAQAVLRRQQAGLDAPAHSDAASESAHSAMVKRTRDAYVKPER